MSFLTKLAEIFRINNNKIVKKDTMKRYLYLIRHASAEEGALFLKDFERELTPSGTIEAARMGKFLKNKDLEVDYVISSSGYRALQTATVICEQLGFPVDNIQATRTIYEDGAKAYLNAVTNAPIDAKKMILVGHNPDITFFAEYLSNAHLGNMNKGSLVIIEFEDKEWSEICSKSGKFIGYHTPNSVYES